jgi:hypothetical protein
MNISMKKFKITPDLIGNYTLCPYRPEDIDYIEKLSPDAFFDVEIRKITSKKERSYEQLKLYWAACRYTAHNTENPDWNDYRKVDEQCKLACGMIDFRIMQGDIVHYKTKSISFCELDHLEATEYFNTAFEFMALFLGMSTDDLIEAVMEEIHG